MFDVAKMREIMREKVNYEAQIQELRNKIYNVDALIKDEIINEAEFDLLTVDWARLRRMVYLR